MNAFVFGENVFTLAFPGRILGKIPTDVDPPNFAYFIGIQFLKNLIIESAIDFKN